VAAVLLVGETGVAAENIRTVASIGKLYHIMFIENLFCISFAIHALILRLFNF
jgi:ribosomal protein S26